MLYDFMAKVLAVAYIYWVYFLTSYLIFNLLHFIVCLHQCIQIAW